MKKDWALISIIGLILVVGLGLVSYLKYSKKKVVANPVASSENKEVAGTTTEKPAYFNDNAKVSFYYSDYCHWCTKQKDEVLSSLGQEGYSVKPVNLGEKPELAKENNVSGTPTFIADNGDRLTGYQSKEALKAFLDNHK